LNTLEEVVLTSTKIPFTGKTLVDEEELLDQLDLIRLNLPAAFQKAQDIIRERDEIIAEAEDYAQQIAAMAEQRAAQMMNETGIVQQAQREAQQIRQEVQQDCDTLQSQTLNDLEQWRQETRQELDEMRQQALAEQREIQQGADQYADSVLGDTEQRLTEMLRVIRNGRQQLDVPPTPVEESPEETNSRGGRSSQRRGRKGRGSNR
jgi:vacuolar-type H+-ATPase subunit H